MAISQLAEGLESFLFNDFESESSEDDLEERDPEFYGMYLENSVHVHRQLKCC